MTLLLFLLSNVYLLLMIKCWNDHHHHHRITSYQSVAHHHLNEELPNKECLSCPDSCFCFGLKVVDFISTSFSFLWGQSKSRPNGFSRRALKQQQQLSSLKAPHPPTGGCLRRWVWRGHVNNSSNDTHTKRKGKDPLIQPPKSLSLSTHHTVTKKQTLRNHIMDGIKIK